MIKYKYQRLSKEEKQEAKLAFYQTEQGLQLKKRFKRIIIYSILLILIAVYTIVDAYINKSSSAYYVYSAMLIVFGISFIILRSYVQMRKVNDFITRKKKN